MIMKNKIKGIIIFLSSLLLILSLGQASGVGAGTEITAISTNLIVTFGEDSLTGSEEGIADVTNTVLEINGLVETAIDTTVIDGLLDTGVYKGITPNTDIVLSYTYLNRGNTTEDVRVSMDIVQDGDTGWTGDIAITANLAEDATYTFIVTINPTSVYNLQQVTVDILAHLITATNVVSYNSFANAIMAYSGPGGYSGYGGTDNITHAYVLEIEAYNSAFQTRTSEVFAPSAYSGATDAVVPGSKIKYDIVIINNSEAEARDIQIRDVIPYNCHLYDNTYSIAGTTAGSESWTGTGDPGSTVGWNDVDIPASSTITATYTVTID
jgi:uncharacterized repeat protein (TIGR01451 family)